MLKARIHGDALTVVIPADIRRKMGLEDGDELEVTIEDSRIVMSVLGEEPLPGEMEALDEAKAEFAQGKTHRLDDVLRALGRKPK